MISRRIRPGCRLLLLLLLLWPGLSNGQVRERATEVDLERRLDRLEAQQQASAEAVKSLGEWHSRYFTIVSILVAVLVGVQAFLQVSTVVQERRRASARDPIVNTGERIDQQGAKRVGDILGVIHQLTQSQLLERGKLEQALATSAEQFADLQKQVQAVIRRSEDTSRASRLRLQDTARQLVKTPRHEFRRLISQLQRFLGDFESHLSTALDRNVEEELLGVRVFYLRGIAAHCMNHPEDATGYLSRVVHNEQPEAGETSFDVKKRVANAYYYLGVNESNFMQYGAAIDYFDEANRRDEDRQDFLTKVAKVEALAMNDDFAAAAAVIERDIDAEMRYLEENGELRSSHQRLRSRAALVRANIAIRKSETWATEVVEVLGPVIRHDNTYYYAIATLAQAVLARGDRERADLLFSEASTQIDVSGDLAIITEARSRILLLMVSAMCCYGAPTRPGRRLVRDYLDEARQLMEDLPKRGMEECTVFSPLSKRNEPKATIAGHIVLIENGHRLPVRGDA